jgi:hypothetical protein
MSALAKPSALPGLVPGVSVLMARRMRYMVMRDANRRCARLVESPPIER